MQSYADPLVHDTDPDLEPFAPVDPIEPFNPPQSMWWRNRVQPIVVGIAAVIITPLLLGLMLFMAAVVAPFAIIVLPIMAWTLFKPKFEYKRPKGRPVQRSRYQLARA